MPKHVRVILLFVGWLLIRATASAQCPQPGFTLPDTVCINQPFNITNTSSGASRYEWDFCSGDLATRPTATELVTVTGASIPTNITTVFDGTNWFAFFFGRENNLLYRLDFGSSPGNVPTVTNLGNLGVAIDKPEPLQFIKEGDNWYAMAANAFGNSNLIRLSFGNSLTAVPTVTDLGNFGGRLNKPRGLTVVQDNGRYVAVVTNAGDNTLVMMNFGSTITASPTAADLIKTPPVSGTLLELTSTSLIRDCGRWFGLTVANANSGVYRLSFGASPFSLPVIDRLSVNIPANASLFNSQIAYDGGYVAVLSGLNRSLFHLNFGETMTEAVPTVTNLGIVEPLSDIAGFTIVKENSKWIALAGSFSSNKVFRLSFPDPCGTPLSLSGADSPATISYSNGGTRKVSLTAYNGAERKHISHPVFVRPPIKVDFSAAGSPPVFTAIPAAGDRFTEWKWEIGNFTSNLGPSVSHSFPANGDYDVTLTAKNVCGETGSIKKRITIAGNTALACPFPAFALPDTVCINEPFRITNNSFGAERYEWDFCSGELTRMPTVKTIATIPSANILSDVTTVFDGVNWYGFASSRDNSKLFRLEFGSSLDNNPAVVELANPGGILIRPEQMKFVKEGENWYALIVTLNNFTNGFGVFRLSFGNNLLNAPQAERLSILDRFLKQPRGITLAHDGSDAIAVIANYASNSLVMVRFAGSITTTPANEDILANNALPNSSSGLIGISLVKSCDQWYGVASSYNNKFYRLNFGTRLFSIPTASDISNLYNFPIGLGRTVLVKNKTDFLAFVLLFNGDLLRYNFGHDMTNDFPEVKKVANFVGDGLGLELVQNKSDQQLVATDFAAKSIYRFSFPAACSAATPLSAQADPALIAYSQSGWQGITLTAYSKEGNISSFTDSVFVRPAVTAGFTVEQQCLGAATLFRASPVPDGNRITSWDWTFSDGSTAAGPNPTRTFAAADTYTAALTVKDICGNTISSSQTVKIYQKTIPAFSGPLEFCSYQPQSFQDASTIADDTPVSRQWDFGNGSKATGSAVTYTYPEPGRYSITFTVTGISGCSVRVSKEVVVGLGVNVKFSHRQACLGSETEFTDESVVPEGVNIVSRTWDFGDKTYSSVKNPVHKYAGVGSYPVTLTIVNSAGCSNIRQETVVIRQPPRAAFSQSLACSGDPVTFTDESNAVEGNISGWEWNFGDPDSGEQNISFVRNPQHLFAKPGNYEVTLKVFTNFGCVDFLTRSVRVTQSPEVDFSYSLDCNTRTVSFTSQSSAGDGSFITDWYWDFGDNTIATTANPNHTYKEAGNRTVTLIITDSFRCQNVSRKTISIYQPPVADFTVPATVCAGLPVVLTDNTVPASGDQVVQWQWQVGAAIYTQSSPSVVFPAGAASVPVTLSVTSASGCTSNITRQITVREAPVAAFSYQTSEQEPLKVNFSGDVNGATGITWDFGDGQTSDLLNPVHRYASGGIYEVILTASNASGCQKKVVRNITVSTVADSYELKLEAVSLVNTGTGSNLRIKLFNRSAKPMNSISFTLIPDKGTPQVQDWSGSLQPGTILSYTFSLPPDINSSGAGIICIHASDLQSGTVSNRQCVNLSNTFSLLNPAPNPANQSFRLGFILPEAGEVRTEMVDATGRVVVGPVTGRYQAGYNEKNQAIVHLARGLYFIRLTFGGQVQVKPLFVH